jgi:hypothetical protein
MLIYRVETSYGTGPFTTGGNYRHDDVCRKYRSYHNPGPSGEVWRFRKRWRRVNQNDYVFGFKSKTQLKMWFRSSIGRRLMAESGFLVSAYSVGSEHYILGRHQVAFNRREAQLKAHFDLVNLRRLH